MGWSGVKNGPLLRRAAQEFDVFLTVDQGVEYQQNLVGVNLGVIVMLATSNDIDDLRPLMPRVREALSSVSPGILFKVKI
jgi:hypothetical protein